MGEKKRMKTGLKCLNKIKEKLHIAAVGKNSYDKNL